MKQQTAVQFLIAYLLQNCDLTDDDIRKFEVALFLEEQQIKLAWENGALPDLLKEYKNSKSFFTNVFFQIK